MDLSYYPAYDRKTIVTQIRDQLTDQPHIETKNRKRLRETPMASWELRIGKFRVFYEIDEDDPVVSVISIGHKEHNVLKIRGREVQL